jgi:hypothetical protein
MFLYSRRGTSHLYPLLAVSIPWFCNSRKRASSVTNSRSFAFSIRLRHGGIIPSFHVWFASVFNGRGVLFVNQIQNGRVVYYIPSHVLVGCIDGIGLFIAKTEWKSPLTRYFPRLVEPILCGPSLVFEIILRLLERWRTT